MVDIDEAIAQKTNFDSDVETQVKEIKESLAILEANFSKQHGAVVPHHHFYVKELRRIVVLLHKFNHQWKKDLK